MIEAYVTASRAEGRYSKTTIDITVGWLEHCQRFSAPKTLVELKSRDLEDWHKSLSWISGPSGKLYSPNTTNQAIGAVRRFYRWALECGLVSENPTTNLRMTPAKGHRWRPTTAEARKLLALTSPETAMGMRDRAILGLLFETRILIPACARLDLNHLQLDTGALLTSGRGGRVHSLSEGLLDDLERYCRHGRPSLDRGRSRALFLTLGGERLNSGAIRSRLATYRKEI